MRFARTTPKLQDNSYEPGKLLTLFLRAFAKADAGAAAVLVDEFDAGHFQGTPILAADKWISDLQFFDYLSLLQVFRIENGTSCAHGCRDDQSIID